MGPFARSPPRVERPGIKQPARRHNEGHPGHAPFAQRIEIIVVREFRTALHLARTHRWKFDVKMRRSHSPHPVMGKELPGALPIKKSLVIDLVPLKGQIKSSLQGSNLRA